MINSDEPINNRDQPAYACPDAGTESFMTWSGQKGLTKRELFAMTAMQGMVAGFDPESKVNGCFIPESVYDPLMQQCVQIADELLKQLEN